jgi:hypothetical protein
MKELLNHLYNQAWDQKNISLSASSKKNLLSAGMIIILSVLVSKQIENNAK